MNLLPDPTLVPNKVEKPTNYRYQVLAWACSLSMLTYIDRVCFKEVGGHMSNELGLNDQEFGYALSAFGLSYALFEVPSGWLGDKFGPRLVLCRIVLWWSLFTAFTGMITKFSWDLGMFTFSSLTLLVIVRFLFGMGEAGAYPNIAKSLRNWFPYSSRGKAQGMLWMFGRWGGALATPLIGVLSLWLGWRGAFIAFGVIGALWVVFFAIFFREHPDQHESVNEAEKDLIFGAGHERQKPPPLSWRTMLKSPTLWCLSLMYFCSNAGWCFFITWDKKFYDKVLHLEGAEMMIASSAPLFFGGIACFLGGFLTDRQVRVWGRRWGRTAQGALAYFLGGFLFLMALAVDNSWASIGCLCAASFMKDFAMASSWSTCIDIGHRYSGTVSGFMNMVGNLGTFFSPTIVAYLAGKDNWQVAVIYSAVMFFLASIGWLFINPRKVIVYQAEDHENLKRQGVIE